MIDDKPDMPWRGIVYGLLFSLPFWALVVWAVWFR